METMERLDRALARRLEAKGYKRYARRFVSATHVVEMIPPGPDNRVTVFVGRCARAGDPSRLADCSRVTMTAPEDLDRFVRSL